MTRDFGRHVFGAAAIAFGALTLRWHAVGVWPQLQILGNGPSREFAVYVAAAAALAGGLAMQWRRTAQPGAVAIGAIYLVFALYCIPRIVQTPLIYDRWGNFFEPLSIFLGALIAYASLSSTGTPWTNRTAKIGGRIFGICVVSFTLEQAFYLRATADLVPTWIPLGQQFWAIVTTIAFAFAAIAIVSGYHALLAARLLTAMLLAFGLLIWFPANIAQPHNSFDWFESAENLAIAGAAWILADSLGKRSTRNLR